MRTEVDGGEDKKGQWAKDQSHGALDTKRPLL